MGQACLASAGMSSVGGRRRRDGLEPELGLVDVGFAVAPPLAARDALGHQCDRLAVGRRRGLELVEIALVGNFQRSATARTDTEDIALVGDVVGRGGEVEPLAIARPGVERDGRVGVRDALERAGGEGEDVDVVGAGAGGLEGEVLAVGGVERARLVGGAGDEKMGLAAGGGRGPDVAAGGEGDLAAVRRDGGCGEGGFGRGLLGGCHEGNAEQKGSDEECAHGGLVDSWR
jgi:hypothetical protein